MSDEPTESTEPPCDHIATVTYADGTTVCQWCGEITPPAE